MNLGCAEGNQRGEPPCLPLPKGYEASGVPMGASQGILLPRADALLKDALFLHIHEQLD